MAIQLRTAMKDELPKLIPLFHDLYRGDIGANFLNIVQEYIDSDSHLVAVATVDGAVIGVLVGSYRLDIDYECRAGFVDAVVVHQDYRNRGIGKRLVEHFAEWAKNRGCTVLQVLNGRRQFFESIGFKERPAVLHQRQL
jgi:GNAT superfamily N-acetyltransferase